MDQGRVLVVDDDPSFAEVMALHLARRGFHVESARDGMDALKTLRSAPGIAVMVTDLMMPGVSGLELLRMARQIDPRLEVIVITAAEAMEMAISALREHGAFDYLRKPLEMMDELSFAVQRAVAHRNLYIERDTYRGQVISQAERLQSLLASVPEAVLSADRRGVLTVVNQRASQLLGHGDIVGADAVARLPEPLARFLTQWLTMEETNPAAQELGWPADKLHKVVLTPLYDRNGVRDGWVMVLQEVTLLRRMERQLARWQEETALEFIQPIGRALALLKAAPERVPQEVRQEVDQALAAAYSSLVHAEAWARKTFRPPKDEKPINQANRLADPVPAHVESDPGVEGIALTGQTGSGAAGRSTAV